MPYANRIKNSRTCFIPVIFQKYVASEMRTGSSKLYFEEVYKASKGIDIQA